MFQKILLDKAGELLMGEVRENVRQNLIYYLALKCISQKELAEALGVSQSAVTNWIKGKNAPDIEYVVQICTMLGISVSEFFGPCADKKNPPRIIASNNGNSNTGEDRQQEIKELKTHLVKQVYAAKLDIRQIKELIGIVNVIEKA